PGFVRSRLRVHSTILLTNMTIENNHRAIGKLRFNQIARRANESHSGPISVHSDDYQEMH
ncbi:MAG: hypothetical protein ACK5T6_08860, partial [Pirellula sp.]